MTSEQWEQVEALFDAALEQPPAFVEDWLAQVCDDAVVRDEAARMIAANSKTEAFLEEPACEAMAHLLRDASEQENRRIGPFRLVRVVGRGGMSTVYLAQRDDGQFDQTVAVKLLRPGFGSGAALQRFRFERQLLASLEHPHIARLYGGGVIGSDGGPDTEGIPYLVMEYVTGDPIDRYCDAHQLTIRDRLRLFTDVCSAVQYAHRNLIVHRDLKPSNIFVTEGGEVKLLDFGIAKLLGERVSPDLSQSQEGLNWMTPEYAAPEQIRGEPVSTATDVYQLGVVLYELLTGHRPSDSDARSLDEIEMAVGSSTRVERGIAAKSTAGGRRIDREAPRRSPEAVARSRGTDVGRLRRELRGDVSAIVLKSLRKDPGERYVSAEAFGIDIRNYLAGRPVAARNGSNAYRVGKFVERHRHGVAAVALLVAILLGLSTYSAWRITASAERARLEARKAERTVEFLVDLFDDADPKNWKLDQNIEAALLVLEPATARVEELDEEPEVQAHLLHTLGVIYMRLGRPDLADSLLLSALAIRRMFRKSRPQDLASSLYAYGQLVSPRDPEKSVRLFREAASIRRASLPDNEADLAWSLLQWARFLSIDHPEKTGIRDEAFGMFERLYGDRSVEMAAAIHEYYVLGFGSKDPEEVVRAFHKALEIEREQLGEEDAKTAVTMHNLGLLLDGQGRHDEADQLLRRSAEISRRALGRDHPRTTAMFINLAAVLHEAGRFTEAQFILRDAVESRRRALPDSSTALAYALTWYGRNLIALDSLREAEAALRESLAIERRIFRDEAPCRLAQGFLGRCLAAQGQFGEAETLLKARFETCDSTWQADAVPRTRTLDGLIDLYEKQGRGQEAARYRRIRAGQSR